MKIHWKKIPREYLECIAHNPNLGVRFYLENQSEIKWWKTEGISFFRRKERILSSRRFYRETRG